MNEREFQMKLRAVVRKMMLLPQHEYIALTFMRMTIQHPEWAQAAIALCRVKKEQLDASDALLNDIVTACPLAVEASE